MTQKWECSFIHDLNAIPDHSAEALRQDSQSESPFLSLAFLKLLADSKSIDGDSGWQSHHIVIHDMTSAELVALIPCYLKDHSYGEYVFDHAWASAYHQHQLPYYPKLLCAVPFTPVTGSRALIHKQYSAKGVSEQDVFSYLAQSKQRLVKQVQASSLHILFLQQAISDNIAQHGLHQRLSVQFVWRNHDYKCIDDFMAELTSRKRRSIRKERAPFVPPSTINGDGSVYIQTLSDDDLTQDIIDDFYLCYQQTYYKRSGHAGYLSKGFFDELLSNLRQHICIVGAFRSQNMIAGSLFFYNQHSLYGRYWGALEDISGLHFECCYYRGIEFAISKGIEVFNPGTQGEHKILRGFRPTFCYSNHYLLEPAFDKAVEDFLQRERPGIVRYHGQASELLPFKSD